MLSLSAFVCVCAFVCVSASTLEMPLCSLSLILELLWIFIRAFLSDLERKNIRNARMISNICTG